MSAIAHDSAETEQALVCSTCGQEIESGDEHTVDEDTYCESCFDETYIICGRCNEPADREDSRQVYTATYHRRNHIEQWCENCVDDHTFRCSDCDDYYSDGCDSVTIYDETVCQSCYENGDYTSCENCGDIITYDNSVTRGESTYCEGCDPGDDEDDDSDDDSSEIHSYSYRPTPHFFGTGHHFGVELEVEIDGSVSDAASDVSDSISNHAYLKSDGSLNHGFEIVTHPHTLAEHASFWRTICDAWPDGLTSYKQGTCGLHVHIERKGLTALQLGKMLVFVNSESNRTFIETVAQRNTSRWAECKPKQLTDATKYPDSRYEALNLMNPATVELRIFRGNTRYDRIMKAIEFAAALVEWTHRDAGLKDLEYQKFTKFVRENRKSYPNLDNFLVEKGYLSAVPKRQKSLELNTEMEDAA